ncbi:MAG: hypothetical protein M3Q89_00825, partial [Verrucomicrobiota bacterium]|nr:hypothetical protein [Verrucomicrobiota bacterium]
GEQFDEFFDVDAISEVKNATALIAATEATGYYDYGAGYWNAMVFRFIPAQFVGKEFKSALMIGGEPRDFGDFIEQVLGARLPTGSTVTGMGDSFNELGYFGCLFFAAMGYLFKSLWSAANQANGTVAQILYIQSVTSAMRTVTHQTTGFLPGFIYGVIFIGAIAWFAKDRTVARPFMPPLRRPESTPPVPR